jgi:hypothetical protein
VLGSLNAVVVLDWIVSLEVGFELTIKKVRDGVWLDSVTLLDPAEVLVWMLLLE